MCDLPWTLGEESQSNSAEVGDRIAGEEKLFQVLVLQHQVAGVTQIVGTQMELVKLDQLLHQEDDGGPGHVVPVKNKLKHIAGYRGCHGDC